MKILENKMRLNKNAIFIFYLIPIILVVSLYILYLIYVLKIGTGPIDYETFMQIGRRLVEGKKIYGENSYYPLPYVGIFSIFSQIPFSISFLTWVVVPVIFAIIISGWSPLILLFGPLFGHFVGGQTAIFGMIGLWGYRKNQSSKWAGIWLSFLLLKPQLAIAPLSWAGYNWVRQFISEKKIPSQFSVFFISTVLIFLPWFFYNPNWVSDWLANPRNLGLRGMAGIIPRLLMYLKVCPLLFWLLIFSLTVSFIYIMNKRKINFDKIILISFVIFPLLNDYDMIQLIPILDNHKKRVWAIICSIPLWFTIFLAYNNDHAWITASLIAPTLLLINHKQRIFD